VPTSTLGYERRFNASLVLADSGRDAFVEGILEGQPEPPLYFGRMKVENRDGTPAPSELGPATELDPEAFLAAAKSDGAVVLDTRRDRDAYLGRHWKGAIWAPWGGADFLAIAGSYIDPAESIVLVGDPALGAEMARALYRIGLDRVVGVASLETLESGLATEGASIVSGDWETVRQQMDDPEVEVLDVRRASEFAAGSVDGARNIAHTRLKARLDELDPGKALLVHCRTGHRATAAVSFLERRGFDVVHIGSTIMDWKPERAAAGG
jgi:hydroxyacylglutathione hydrolase